MLVCEFGLDRRHPAIAGAVWAGYEGSAQADKTMRHNRPKHPDSDRWVGLAICRMLNAVSADER